MAKFERKTTRRDFLRGESAIEAIGDLTHGVGPHSPQPGVAGQAGPGGKVLQPLINFARTAMACEFVIFLRMRDDRYGPQTAMAALDLIDELEDQLTVYREHSEVMEINRTASAHPVVVETGLFGLLQQATQLHKETDGAFDITSGPLTKIWGFYRREGRLPSDDEITEALVKVGGDALIFDDSNQTVAFDKPGLEINLGAIGKGYALDVAVKQMQASGAKNFLFHGGSSSVVARGDRAGASDEKTSGPKESSEKEDGNNTKERTGWPVGIVHPLRPDRRFATVHLVDEAIGTSGAGTQHFYHQGKKYGHILDPRTGRPTEGVLSATVIAPTAAEADALATACYVMGRDAAERYCRKHPEIGLLLMTPGQKSGGIEITTVNIDEDRIEI